MDVSGKHASLQYGSLIYHLKKFYSTGPRIVVVTNTREPSYNLPMPLNSPTSPYFSLHKLISSSQLGAM
jgi:hypothetical protein